MISLLVLLCPPYGRDPIIREEMTSSALISSHWVGSRAPAATLLPAHKQCSASWSRRGSILERNAPEIW